MENLGNMAKSYKLFSRQDLKHLKPFEIFQNFWTTKNGSEILKAWTFQCHILLYFRAIVLNID